MNPTQLKRFSSLLRYVAAFTVGDYILLLHGETYSFISSGYERKVNFLTWPDRDQTRHLQLRYSVFFTTTPQSCQVYNRVTKYWTLWIKNRLILHLTMKLYMIFNVVWKFLTCNFRMLSISVKWKVNQIASSRSRKTDESRYLYLWMICYILETVRSSCTCRCVTYNTFIIDFTSIY